MKKKLIIIALAILSIITISSESNAQVIIYSNRCCDASNQMRCLQDNMTPVGSSCYCPYQGFGRTC